MSLLGTLSSKLVSSKEFRRNKNLFCNCIVNETQVIFKKLNKAIRIVLEDFSGLVSAPGFLKPPEVDLSTLFKIGFKEEIVKNCFPTDSNIDQPCMKLYSYY